MIEQQTIGGRAATVSYLTRDFGPAGKDDFDFAKVVFEDGDVVFLVRESDPPPLEDDAIIIDVAQHELDNNLPNWLAKPPVDPEPIRARVRAKNRARYAAERVIERKRVSAATLTAHRQLYEGIKARAAAGIPRRKELPVADQLAIWQRAIKILDESEDSIRDAIEREWTGGMALKMRPRMARMLAQQIMRSTGEDSILLGFIRSTREKAIKDAFRLVRDKLGNRPILGVSIAVWAGYFTKLDYQAIALGIQVGMVDGLDNAEMARKIVGSALLNGSDGVTEQTRFKIAHLARAAIKESNYRKRGLDADGAAVKPTKGLDPAS